MSETVKKFTGLELEFMDPTTHGFISWMDFNTGKPLATLGLGSTAKDIGTNDQGETIGIDNGGSKYLEWNLQDVDYIKITGGDIQFDNQCSLSVNSTKDIIIEDEYGKETITPETYIPSQIQLNLPNYTDIEKANIIYPYIPPILVGNEYVEQKQTEDYLRLKTIKDEYTDNTNALTIEHENAIVFINPMTKRLLGEIDTVNESFGWYGAFAFGDPAEDSMLETKRVDPLKYNLTLNADANNLAQLAFKKEDAVVWSVSATVENLNITNENGNGILITDANVTFTGEIIYQGTSLMDYFYTQTVLDEGALDTRYYTKDEVNTIVSNIENDYNVKIDELKAKIEYLQTLIP